MSLVPALPADSCDCHMHVFDRRFPALTDAMYREATAADYRELTASLGVARTVIVQPSGYGFDNACTLDALAQLGSGARAIVVIPPDIEHQELTRLHSLGVRGVRFMLLRPGGLSWEHLAPMAEAAKSLGWNLNLQFDGHELPQRLATLRALSAPVVIDHMGAFGGGVTPRHESFRALLGLLEGGNAWVKLSAPYAYRMSAIGHPGYPEVAALVRQLARAFPERCLWATDWPHVSEPALVPDTELAAGFRAWIDDDSLWQRVLVDNPACLYDFASNDNLNPERNQS